MRKRVLILTNSFDGTHSDIVISKLKDLGLNVFRCDVDSLAKGDTTIKFFASSDSFGFEMANTTERLLSDDIKSVWYRRPNRFSFPISDRVQRDYAEMETTQFLEGLWSSMSDEVFWLSNPVCLERARKKILQLKIAQTLGLTVPRTIVTNDPMQVKRFFKACDEKIIFKAIHHEVLDYEEKSFNVPTTLIGRGHLNQLNLVKKMPSLFQEFIDKKYEIRVTIVGDSVFPVKIDSQVYEETAVDWRHPDFISKLRYTPTDLPKPVEDGCRAMLRIMGLEFGAFDFAVDKNGNHYFLEVNPNGQWYWLEDATGLLISDAVVAMLARDR